MRPRRSRPTPTIQSSAFKGFRFPPEIIVLAVRWYLRYGLSYRDVEELLGERDPKQLNRSLQFRSCTNATVPVGGNESDPNVVQNA